MSRIARIVMLLVLVAGCTSGPTTTAPGSAAAGSPSSPPSLASSARPAASPLTLFGPLPTTKLDAATAAKLQKVLDGQVAAVAAPDVIAAVITPDGIWSGASGEDGPAGQKAAPDHEFGIASVSKTIVGALVMRLVELGKIDLDAPLADYLKGLSVNANGASVRQALAMRSGLRDTADGAIDQAFAACDRPWTTDQVLGTITAPVESPGVSYYYSNPTAKLVGLAAGQAAGMPLGEALKTYVLRPAGTDRILLQGPDASPPKPWALPVSGHTGPLAVDAFGTGGTLPCLGFSTLSLGASAMAADAPSLARWAWQLFAGKVVSADSLAAMTTVDDTGRGLGIDRVDDFSPNLAFGHSGSQPGYASALTVLPEKQIVVVAFSNDQDADPFATARQLVDVLNGH